MVQRDGNLHEYATKSMRQLLSIPRDKLDNQLPKEVLLLVCINWQFVQVWETIPRIRVQGTQASSTTLRVHVRRLNRTYGARGLVFAPRFPKPQQESWFVLVLDFAGKKLVALERLTLPNRGEGEGRVELEIPADYVGKSLTIKVLSDGWRGVDVEKHVEWQNETGI